MIKKLMKFAVIALFAFTLIFNVTFYLDSNPKSNAEISLGSLKVSLFQKAYALYWPVEMNNMGDGLPCMCQPNGCWVY